MTENDTRRTEELSEASHTNDYLYRIREFADRRYALVVIVLIALVAASGYFAFTTHAAPETQTEQEVVATWTESGEFTHQATVQEDTAVFERGTELTDRSTYFTRVSPELTVEYGYQHGVSDNDLDVRTELLLEIRSAEEEEVYWEVTEPIDSVHDESLSAGETQTVSTTINVTELEQRVQTIENDLGASPGDTEVELVARSEVVGTAGGEAVEDVREDAISVSPAGGTYRVESVQQGSDIHEITQSTTEPVEYGLLRSVGSPLLLLISLVGFGALVAARKTGRLAPPTGERERRRYYRERKEFDDWVSAGKLPTELSEKPSIEVDSLEGLVDVAIDSDRRVIEDTSEGRCYVVDDAVIYEYRLPVTTLPDPDDRSVDRHTVDEETAASDGESRDGSDSDDGTVARGSERATDGDSAG